MSNVVFRDLIFCLMIISETNRVFQDGLGNYFVFIVKFRDNVLELHFYVDLCSFPRLSYYYIYLFTHLIELNTDFISFPKLFNEDLPPRDMKSLHISRR